jgi:hypothetical protein
MTFPARFPGGATFIIVGPHHPADVDDRESNNIEDGTSAARDPSLSEHPNITRLWEAGPEFLIPNS